jgi:hypothetical protein
MPAKENVMADVKKDLTVSSTTDTQEEINLAAGIETEEAEEEEAPEETEEAATETEEEQEGKTEEKSEEESSAATEEETEEAETPSESETEEETEEEEAEEEVEAEKPVAKKKGKWSKRVDRLTAKLSAAEREIQRLKSGAKEEEAEEEESEVEPVKAAATDRPKRADFKTQEEYEDAVTDWKIDKRDAERKVEAAKAESKKEFDTYIATQESFKAEHDDYQDLADEMTERKIFIPEAVQVAIIQLNRPDIAYHLAKNLDIIEDMSKVSQTKAVAMVGKIMAELDSKKSAPGSKPSKVATKVAATETPKKKTAPTTVTTPIKPVKSSSAKSSKLSLNDPNLPFEEYKKRRAAGES